MTQKDKSRGLLGVAGIWLTAGVAFPFVNIEPLASLSLAQIIMFRGYGAAILALIFFKSEVLHADKFTKWMFIVMPLATIGLFEGFRHWGLGPTIIVITATPLVNFVISLKTRRKISSAAPIGLAAIFAGVICAWWGPGFDLSGFTWSVFATVMNGFLYECLSRAEKGNFMKKVSWACAGMGTGGLVYSFTSLDSWGRVFEPHTLAALSVFAFVAGFLYWLFNMWAFQGLRETTAAVLAQGETPFVIAGGIILLGESITPTQFAGVILAIIGAGYLAFRTAQESHEEMPSDEELRDRYAHLDRLPIDAPSDPHAR